MTEKAAADVLGITTRTLRNAKNNGFTLELTDDQKVDVDKTVHAYVKYQSKIIRELRAKQGRISGGNSGNSGSEEKDGSGNIDWKAEKDKQAAIKARLANSQSMGDLIPAIALVDLINAPLSLFRSQLFGLSNQIQKRVPVDPAIAKAIDDEVRSALERLNEKGSDELQDVIQQVIERYSKYYSATDEDGDYPVVDEE